jgi:hypothetical protein
MQGIEIISARMLRIRRILRPFQGAQFRRDIVLDGITYGGVKLGRTGVGAVRVPGQYSGDNDKREESQDSERGAEGALHEPSFLAVRA